MNFSHTLSSLQPGERARICNLDATSNLYLRLQDMGLIDDTIIECVGESPHGDPRSFLIRGTVIALRDEDIQHITIQKLPSSHMQIALAGNPNVGKSTVFNGLTGLKQHTGNWPGKTIAQARGYYNSGKHSYEIIDLPGTYSLSAQSPEEEVAGDYLLYQPPDMVIAICDATSLERNLILILQLQQIAPHLLVCLNLMDEAKRKGIDVDVEALSQILNLPVVPISARKKSCIRQLISSIDCQFEQFAASSMSISNTINNPPADSNESLFTNEKISPASAFVKQAEDISNQVTTFRTRSHIFSDRKIDHLLTSKITGYPIMLCLLVFVFWLTIVGANYPSQLLSSWLFQIQDILTLIFQILNVPNWLYGILVLGIYRVLAWVIAVMLPPMAIFFPLFTLLEDIGYLPRVAYNLDKPFHCCQSCGKQSLCMCMGVGCNAVGIMGCRIIQSPRERLIAILTNSFVPCNGRFPTLIALLTMFFVSTSSNHWATLQAASLLTLLILISVMMTLIISKLLSLTLLKGLPSAFILELPPYRRPQLSQILLRSLLDRTLHVLGRAIVVAAPAGCIIWLTANLYIGQFSIFQHLANFLEPLANIMGIDGVILLAFILGLPANEIVMPIIIMGYLSEASILELGSLNELKLLFLANGWTTTTAICVMIFSLFHWPCSTTLLTIRKETDHIKWVILAVLLPTCIGIISCIIINFLLT